jgi:mannosyltransferase
VSAGSLTARDLLHRDSGRPRGQAEPLSPGLLAGLGALIVVAALLRFYGIGHQGFWYDEADTAQLMHFSLGEMIGLLPHSESTPPLYYCVAWVWTRVFGDGEAGLRSLSALAGVLVVPVAFAAGFRLLRSHRAALIAAALTACNPLLIWYSQEARAYELLVLLAGVSLLGFAMARDDPRPRHIALWALAALLSLATHYYAVVIVVPEALWLLAEHRRRVSILVGSIIVALGGAALLPLAVSQNHTGNDSWIAHAPFGQRMAQILPQFILGTDAPARTILKIAGFVLTAAALGLLGVSMAGRGGVGRGRGREGTLAAAWLAAGGFLLALLFVLAGFDDLITRNLIALWLPAACVVSAGLVGGTVWNARGRFGLAVAAGLCVIGITATVGVATDRSFQRPDWRPVARILGPAPSGGAGRAILVQHYAYLLPLSLYLPHLRRLTGAVRVRELDVITLGSPQQPNCWWGAACNLIPSQMQSSYPIAGLHPAGLRRVHQFTILRLVADHPVTLTRQIVAPALRTTTLRHDVLIDQAGAAPRARRR